MNGICKWTFCVVALTANHRPPWCHQNAPQCWLALWCRGKIIKVMLVIYIRIKKWWSLPIDQVWWNVWWKAGRSRASALIFPQALMLALCKWQMVWFWLLCKMKIKIKWVTHLGKAVWRLSSDAIAFSLDIISPHIPASLPSARQISAFINKQLSTKVSLNNMPWHFFSPAALTPGLLFLCLFCSYTFSQRNISLFAHPPPQISHFL